ncbi:MAG TPA: ABC transporter substrate-binding protein [Acidothermaceae bacterium]|nr:ABC transporter substrate-binding protein [Acidothermaceae bacterium]
MRRPIAVFTALLSLVALSAACASGAKKTTAPATPPASAGRTIIVAAFNFSESQVLANMFADVLDNAGFRASVKTLTTREVVQPALWRGDVDVVPEYTSSLATYLNNHDMGSAAPSVASSDLTKTLSALRAAARRHHLVVLDPSSAANQNAFAVTRAFAEANQLTTLSDLARYRGGLTLGGPAECPTRPYCEPGLESTYGITFTSFRTLDAGGPLTKLALKSGLIQVGLVFSSDPGIAAYGLQILSDDKQLQDADVVVPVVNEDVASVRLAGALEGLMKVLTTSDLIQLNASAELQHVDPATVAHDYLAGKALLPST